MVEYEWLGTLFRGQGPWVVLPNLRPRPRAMLWYLPTTTNALGAEGALPCAGGGGGGLSNTYSHHPYWICILGGQQYSCWRLPPDLTVQGINGASNDDFECVEAIRVQSCPGKEDCPSHSRPMCVCSTPVTVCLQVACRLLHEITVCLFVCFLIPPPPLHLRPR